MKIEAERNRYHGDTGWESDPKLFAQVAVTWKQWIGQAGEHLYAAQILLPHIQHREAEIERLMKLKDRGTARLVPPSTDHSFSSLRFFARERIQVRYSCTVSHRDRSRDSTHESHS